MTLYPELCSAGNLSPVGKSRAVALCQKGYPAVNQEISLPLRSADSSEALADAFVRRG
jgi:hypothetical protein